MYLDFSLIILSMYSYGTGISLVPNLEEESNMFKKYNIRFVNSCNIYIDLIFMGWTDYVAKLGQTCNL